MSDTAIRISNLSKSYRIQRDDTPRATNLGEAIGRKLRSPLKKTPSETFWALKDIDLEIKKGEVVGVIGRNGAGKSTLLKVLSRITEPTTGRIELFGRVGSLLEVGTGFHPELTGRENIFLNGAILGMRRCEIKKQFDAIVDFAGVEKFLDTPVKRYSSGMYVRLAFAVAAHLNPEILIVDEVLAVGDAEFQKKCLCKMQDVAQSGRTVLFVSHNMAAVEKLCKLAVLLNRGSVVELGATTQVLDSFNNLLGSDTRNHYTTRIEHVGEVRATISSASRDGAILAGDALQFSIKIDAPEVLRVTRVGLGIDGALGNRICTLISDNVKNEVSRSSRSHSFVCEMRSPLLSPGKYSVKLAINDGATSLIERESCMQFEVECNDFYGTGKLPSSTQGPTLPLAAWEWSNSVPQARANEL